MAYMAAAITWEDLSKGSSRAPVTGLGVDEAGFEVSCCSRLTILGCC